ncbi:MAG: MarR family transcriptional regulator [Flavobacteriales bacterium]
MKPEETIDFHIRWAWLKIAKMYNRMGAQVGISQSMGLVLLSIDPKLGTPSTSLGPMMGMEPTSLTRTLKSMEEKGWIARKPDLNDGRVSRIYLTEQGEKLREVSKETVIDFNERLLQSIDPQKLQHFREVIEMIDQQTMN